MNKNNELNNFGRMRCHHESNSRLGVCGEKAQAEKKGCLTTINQHTEITEKSRSWQKRKTKAYNHGEQGEINNDLSRSLHREDLE